jgi:hypothetical protein
MIYILYKFIILYIVIKYAIKIYIHKKLLDYLIKGFFF